LNVTNGFNFIDTSEMIRFFCPYAQGKI